MKNCTLLIQGKINDECFNLWIKNYSDWNVVVSIWDNEDIKKYKFPKKWKIVFNQYPKKRFATFGNFDYQIMTTINGLRNIETDWVIKARVDEYWSNLDIVYNMMLRNKNKIMSSSMFFREWGLYDFHPGDKILAGSKDNLYLMFNIAYNIVNQNVLECKVPETFLGLGYLVGKAEIDFNEQFIYSFNNRTAKFDRQSAFDAMKAAYKAIKKDFEKILKDEKTISLEKTNEVLEHSKKIVYYCISYNELAEKLKSRIDVKENEVGLMQKHFEVIDINELKPYIATRNFGEGNRVWYRDDFDNKKENCLETLN